MAFQRVIKESLLPITIIFTSQNVKHFKLTVPTRNSWITTWAAKAVPNLKYCVFVYTG